MSRVISSVQVPSDEHWRRVSDEPGHDVTIGVRDPDDAKHVDLQNDFVVRSPDVAVVDADIVILAVPMDALEAKRRCARAGPFARPGRDRRDQRGAHPPCRQASRPSARSSPRSCPPAFLPIAGDDAGRPLVISLATDLGFDAADVGGPEAIALVEAFSRLWIHLAFNRGWGRDFGFAAIRP